MKEKTLLSRNRLIQYAILVYWCLFWLFNSIDKVIGGAHFLWVGRDRFSQFQKFFASTTLEAPIIADLALIIAAALEIFAFIFFVGALIHFAKNRQEKTRSWFFIGIILTLITFVIFSIGDHIFGDRFELLEHTLFWFITLFSWVIFTRIHSLTEDTQAPVKKTEYTIASLIALVLVYFSSYSIFSYNNDHFNRRTDALQAEKISEDTYKISYPFLGGSTVFEKSIALFLEEHPDKKIDHIYTAPNELRLKKADGLIFYIITEDK